MKYEYNERKRVICIHSVIDNRPLYPYTWDKDYNCWNNRSGCLTRQRIWQLEKEDRINWNG